MTDTPDLIARVPVVALVGRPNVGKSTLFNRFTGTRDALVANLPGLTRDRQYGHARFEEKTFIVVDTGGLSPVETDALALLAEEQAQIALAEADHVFFLVDFFEGCMADDQEIARKLRKLGKPISLLVNKAEGQQRIKGSADFYTLGLGEPQPVSAEHGDGIAALLRNALAPFAPMPINYDDDGIIHVAIVGRPNAGKSTLMNRLLGHERVLTASVAGTTRDAITEKFDWNGQTIELTDTAGIRRRSRVDEVIEKFSIVKALTAVERAQVVIVMCDAQEDIATHDAKLMGLIAQRGRAMVLAINKWDNLEPSKRDWIKNEIDYRLPFLDFVQPRYISALHGSGLREMMEDVLVAYAATTRDIPTPELTRALERAVDKHSPPAVLGRRIKLRYAHQIGTNPIKILVHGNQTDKLPLSYHRYLINEFRSEFKLQGAPVVLEFKTGDNPYAGRVKEEVGGRLYKKPRRLIQRSKR